MMDLRVSYSTLDEVHRALGNATATFDAAEVPADGGAFGADDVTQAFATFRTAQQRSTEWLADVSRTLAHYAHDTKSSVRNADDDLARKAGHK